MLPKTASIHNTGKLGGEELLVDAAESSVAEYAHDISRSRLGRQMEQNGVRAGKIGRREVFPHEVGNQLLRIQTLVRGELIETRHLRHHHAICQTKGGGEFVLKDVAAGGVGAGLEDRPKTPGWKFMS